MPKFSLIRLLIVKSNQKVIKVIKRDVLKTHKNKDFSGLDMGFDSPTSCCYLKVDTAWKSLKILEKEENPDSVFFLPQKQR